MFDGIGQFSEWFSQFVLAGNGIESHVLLAGFGGSSADAAVGSAKKPQEAKQHKQRQEHDFYKVETKTNEILFLSAFFLFKPGTNTARNTSADFFFSAIIVPPTT